MNWYTGAISVDCTFDGKDYDVYSIELWAKAFGAAELIFVSVFFVKLLIFQRR